MQIFGNNNNHFFKQKLGHFHKILGQKHCIMMYLGNTHSMYRVPVTFGNFFFLSSKNGPFLAELKMFIGGFHHLLHLPPTNPSEFKQQNTIGKKVPCHFCQKNVFFGQKKTFFQKSHFIQKLSLTQYTVFQWAKIIFLLSQQKLVFFTRFNLPMTKFCTYLFQYLQSTF